MNQTLLQGKSYTPAVATDIRALFDRVRPGWNKPPKAKQAKVKRKKS